MWSFGGLGFRGLGLRENYNPPKKNIYFPRALKPYTPNPFPVSCRASQAKFQQKRLDSSLVAKLSS